MGGVFTSLARGLLHLGISAMFLLAQPLQWGALVYVGYVQIYEPLASTPGARDGTALLFIMGGVLLGALLLTVVLAVLEVWILRALVPSWEPPDAD
jgi:hypothetical protein